MFHLKTISTLCVVTAFAMQAGATPMATSTMSVDLSTATISCIDGGSVSVLLNDNPEAASAIHLEADGFDMVAQEVFGTGTLSETLSGASATAVSQNHTSFNSASATALDGSTYSTSTSITSAYLVLDATDVSSIAVTLDVTSAIELLTEATDEFAWGQADIYFDLFQYDSAFDSWVWLTGDYYSDYQEAFDGVSNAPPYDITFNLSHVFSDSPYSGLLSLQSNVIVQAGVQAPANVPEPSSLSLMALGLVTMGCAVKFRKNKQR